MMWRSFCDSQPSSTKWAALTAATTPRVASRVSRQFLQARCVLSCRLVCKLLLISLSATGKLPTTAGTCGPCRPRALLSDVPSVGTAHPHAPTRAQVAIPLAGMSFSSRLLGRQIFDWCGLWRSQWWDDGVVPPHGVSEMQRSPLERLLLQTLVLGVEQPEPFLLEAMDPPQSVTIREAVSRLATVGAVESGADVASCGALTDLGRICAELPLDIQLSK
eukprot:SAG11_NODE_570_length_8454_cov_19.886655_7_plen_219_part_00